LQQEGKKDFIRIVNSNIEIITIEFLRIVNYIFYFIFVINSSNTNNKENNNLTKIIIIEFLRTINLESCIFLLSIAQL